MRYRADDFVNERHTEQRVEYGCERYLASFGRGLLFKPQKVWSIDVAGSCEKICTTFETALIWQARKSGSGESLRNSPTLAFMGGRCFILSVTCPSEKQLCPLLGIFGRNALRVMGRIETSGKIQRGRKIMYCKRCGVPLLGGGICVDCLTPEEYLAIYGKCRDTTIKTMNMPDGKICVTQGNHRAIKAQ